MLWFRRKYSIFLSLAYACVGHAHMFKIFPEPNLALTSLQCCASACRKWVHQGLEPYVVKARETDVGLMAVMAVRRRCLGVPLGSQ